MTGKNHFPDDLELADGGIDATPVETCLVLDAPDDEPEPPDAPAYVVDGLDRQDADDLRELARYALERAAYLDALESQDLDPDEVVDGDEQLVDVDQDASRGAIVKKKIPCGKGNCSTCPHGPYKYRVYRDGDKVVTEYEGPA